MKKGFTLIELLVVISIISLLSSIVLSSLQSAREQSIQSATFSTMMQINRAMSLYYNKYGNYPVQQTAVGTQFDETSTGYISYFPVNKIRTDGFIPTILNSEMKKAVRENQSYILYRGGDTGPYASIEPHPGDQAYAFSFDGNRFFKDAQQRCLTSQGIHLESSENDIDNECEQR